MRILKLCTTLVTLIGRSTAFAANVHFLSDDDGYQYTGTQYDFNNSDGTEITATAICATIVSQVVFFRYSALGGKTA